jgi:hypothetical protein
VHINDMSKSEVKYLKKKVVYIPLTRRVDVRQAAGRKNNCRIFITT